MLDRLSVSLAIATIVAVLAKITYLYEQSGRSWFVHDVNQETLYYILIGIFLVFLRGKMMHDDSGYFQDIDAGKFETDWGSIAVLKIGLLSGYLSWLLWAPGIYTLDEPEKSSVFFGTSLLISTAWLVSDIVTRKGLDKRRAWWVVLNLIYIAGFVVIFWGGVPPSLPAAIMVFFLFVDWVTNDPFASHIPQNAKSATTSAASAESGTENSRAADNEQDAAAS